MIESSTTQKTFLIAGGSSGIGYQLSCILEKEGHKVIVLSRNRKSLSETITHHSVDFSEDVLSFPELEMPLHGIAYLPGSINLKPFKAFTRADFIADFSLNVLGATETIKKYLPNLNKASHSKVVLVSSVAATIGMPYHALVGASKGAIEGLTKTLAAELAPNINVNAIAPSLTDTPMAEKFLNTEEKRNAGMGRHPMQQVGSAYDMAQLIAFLLSIQANFISGQIIHADGGMSSIRKF